MLSAQSLQSKSTNMEVWTRLGAQASRLQAQHLRTLLSNKGRNQQLTARFEDILLDYSHSKVDEETMQLLGELAQATGLYEKIAAMFRGEVINTTEKRQVLHVALRMKSAANPALESIVQDVLQVKARVSAFAQAVRSGESVGITGQTLTTTLCIGIGGSYLGPEFVAEALRTEKVARAAAQGRTLRFLANVDPVDFIRATEGLDPSRTLVVIISKTFTTAETMMNAKRVRDWLLAGLSTHPANEVLKRHLCAVSTNLQKTAEFGVDSERVFGFWDWVGGRFSVSSAVGLMPLYLQYGEVIDQFLAGASSIDDHFLAHANATDYKQNLPLLMGLLGVWNTTCLGLSSRAVLPYSQALVRFPAHIQQLDMESNGKQCSISGTPVPSTGPIVFGEPGTNGQHSFYQLLHQGRTVPAEFIGFCKSQSDDSEAHNELMSNFFAQPDALALGKTLEDLSSENCSEALRIHKLFPGDKPSLSLLFGELNAYTCGQLLALYEHRVAVEGFIWGINSFDQYGVELGKVLATRVKGVVERNNPQEVEAETSASLLQFFLARH